MKKATGWLCAVLTGVCQVWAAEILRLDVEAEPDGRGTVTCLVDSEADLARVRVTVMTRDGLECARVDEKAAFSVNWAQPQTRKMSVDWKVENPLVWTDERPVLYFVRFELLDARGVQRAVSLARFAFFRMEVRADDGFYLNGTKLRFKGVTLPWCDWASRTNGLEEACRTLAADARRLNANALYCTNVPPEALLAACDEAGVFVLGPHVPRGTHPCAAGWTPLDGLSVQRRASFGTINACGRRKMFFLPVDLLPVCGDGGGGAGLTEAWRTICLAPRCPGGVLQLPDGWTWEALAGTREEIRTVWAPVSVSLSGRTLTFVNRQRFLGQDLFRYKWEARTFSAAAGQVIQAGAWKPCPPARSDGGAQVTLPPLPPSAQAVRVSVASQDGTPVCVRDFALPATTPVPWPNAGCAPPPGLEHAYLLALSRTNWVVTARKRRVRSPVFYPVGSPLDRLNLTWGRLADGTYRLDYKMTCRANAEVLGFAFDPPAGGVRAVRWQGKGPQRVWNNSLEGRFYGVWRLEAPHLVESGFLADTAWCDVETAAGTYRFTPARGPNFFAPSAPVNGPFRTDDGFPLFHFPSFGPGVFVRIPGIGNAREAAEQTGPAGRSRWFHYPESKQLTGTLLVTWTPHP